MIILVTGKPGGGKTSWVVSQFLEGGEFYDRPMHQDGIPDLVLPHEVIDATEWMNAPPKSVVVIDEAQRIFRPRPVGSKVPLHVSELETHRHKGIDIIIITQHPNLLDTNVRRLVGRHVHFRQTSLHKEKCEWHDGAHDPDSSTELAKSIRNPTKLQAKSFGLYKSSVEHTKIKRKLPWQLFLIVGCMILAIVLGYVVYQRMVSKTELAPAPESGQGGDAVPNGSLPSPSSSPVRQGDGTAVVDYVPRLVHYPQTAPVYDGVRQVVEAPELSGCISNSRKCTCYDQRGTVVDMPESNCRSWQASPKFDPFRSIRDPAGVTQLASASPATGEATRSP